MIGRQHWRRADDKSPSRAQRRVSLFVAVSLLTIAIAPRFIPGLGAGDAGASTEVAGSATTTTPPSTTGPTTTAAPTTTVPASTTSVVPTTVPGDAGSTTTTTTTATTTTTTDPGAGTTTTAAPTTTGATTTTEDPGAEGAGATESTTTTSSTTTSSTTTSTTTTSTTTTTVAPTPTHAVTVSVVDADGAPLAADDIAVAGADAVFSSIGGGASATTPALPEDTTHTIRATRNGASVSATVVPSDGASVQLMFGMTDVAISVVDGDGDPLEVLRLDVDTGAGWVELATGVTSAVVSQQIGESVHVEAVRSDGKVQGSAVAAVDATIVLQFSDVRDVVTLQAVDAGGAPVVVAEIQVHDGSWRTVATDASSVAVTGLGEGAARHVRMRHHGQWRTQRFVPAGGSETITIAYEFVDADLRLVDQNDEPVTVTRIQGYGPDRQWRDLATNAASASMSGLVVGNTYHFRALHHGQWRQERFVAAAPSSSVTIAYEADASATFNLVDSDGDPVQVARIQGYGADRTWRDLATNASSATMTGLLRGNVYYFRALHHGQWKQVRLTTDEATTTVSHVYVSNGTAGLSIVDTNGAPVVVSRIQGYGADRSWADIATDASSAQLTDLIVGNVYYFRALHHGRWTTATVRMESASASATITYESTSATFRLIDTEGNPVVVDRIQGYDGNRQWRDLATSSSEASMPDLVVGAVYYFRAQHHGQWKQVRFSATSGENAAQHVYEFTNARLTLVDQDGQPVQARIQGYGGDRRWRDLVTSGSSADMSRLVVGNVYYFRSQVQGSWERTRFVAASGANEFTHDFEFVDVSVRLVDENGAPVSAAHIHGWGANRRWTPLATESTTATLTGLLAGGRFHLPGAPPRSLGAGPIRGRCRRRADDHVRVDGFDVAARRRRWRPGDGQPDPALHRWAGLGHRR